MSFRILARQIAEIGRAFHARGWLLATSGNLSAVVSRDPFRLAITESGVDKGEMAEVHVLEINAEAELVRTPAGDGSAPGFRTGPSHDRRTVRDQARADGAAGAPKPSDESLLHIRIVRTRGAGAVLHTHSLWSTIVSEACARDGGVVIEGYEMLKALHGVKTHEHREWLPILENAQDMAALAERIERALTDNPGAHGFLLRGHGLYAWGETLGQAKRHAEALEFLLEAIGRSRDLAT